MERGHKNNSQRLSDFCDGSYFSSHSLFGVCSGALQILFYYDDVEMCNPLGSHSKKHRLGIKGNIAGSIITFLMVAGIFYFLLGNLHPKYRSRLKSIQLLALCKTSYIKKYSLHAVLSPIVNDIKKLVS